MKFRNWMLGSDMLMA